MECLDAEVWVSSRKPPEPVIPGHPDPKGDDGQTIPFIRAKVTPKRLEPLGRLYGWGLPATSAT